MFFSFFLYILLFLFCAKISIKSEPIEYFGIKKFGRQYLIKFLKTKNLNNLTIKGQIKYLEILDRYHISLYGDSNKQGLFVTSLS